MTLAEVAEVVGGRLQGDGEVRVSRVQSLERAGPDALALLSDRRYLQDLGSSRARALLLSSALQSLVGDGRPAVIVDDPHLALVALLPVLYPPLQVAEGVHPTAVIGRGVAFGRGVRIGPYAVVEDGCVLGDSVSVGAHAVIGRDSSVGEETVLHPQVVLYPRTEVGRRVIVHAGARLGSDGFGYAFARGSYEKVPQVGRCIIEDDVEIGANSCVDRGSIDDTVIGKGSKLDNLVHIAHNVRLGPNCALAAMVGIAGSTVVGEGVVFAGQSGSVGHVEIGAFARVGAKAGVTSDVTPGEAVAGFPARSLRDFLKGTAFTLRLPELERRIRKLEEASGAKGARTGTPVGEDAR